MTEVWLRTNRRALAACTVAAGLLVLIGLLLARGESGSAGGVRWCAGVACAVVGGLAAIVLVHFMLRPLVAYRHGRLLIYVRIGRPVVLPIEVVECFFLGEAGAALPGRRAGSTRVTTVVVRLSEAAGAWQRQPVNPLLGHWQDGYIIIRGTWCEPIDFDFVNGLNARLRELQIGARDRAAADASQAQHPTSPL